MAKDKIYLVVLADDMTSISWASRDQYKAQQMCHKLTKKYNIPHAVVTEKSYNVPMIVKINLK